MILGHSRDTGGNGEGGEWRKRGEEEEGEEKREDDNE